MCKALSLLALSLPIAAMLSLAAPETAAASDIDEGLNHWLSQAECCGFSGSVLVARGDEPVFAKGYGSACRETVEPNMPDSIFDIASLTKQFTAALILRLEAKGVLHTDDPISKHLPGVPEDKRGITIHHLLTHSSGLPASCAVPIATREREELLRAVLSARLERAPGTGYAYCNAGYGLLAAILVEICDDTFEALMRREVFKPAGLERTCFFGDPVKESFPFAHAYDWIGSSGDGPAPRSYGWGLRGSGGVLSTLTELHSWDKLLRAPGFLSPAAKRKLFTPVHGGYACGWMVTETARKTKLVLHGGTTFGLECVFARYVDEDVTVILYSNRNAIFAGRPLCTEKAILRVVEAIVFGGEPPFLTDLAFSLDSRDEKRISGTYYLDTGGRIEIEAWSETYFARPLGQDAFDLLAEVVRGPESPPPPMRSLGSANPRAERLVRAIQEGNLAPTGALLHPATPVGWLADWRKKQWLSELAGRGPVSSVAVVASWEPGDGSIRTVVRIQCRGGASFLEVISMNGKITALRWAFSHPGEVLIRPVSKEKAIYHDFFFEKSRELRFVWRSGKVTGLEVAGVKLARR